MADSSDEILDSEIVMRRVPANPDLRLFEPDRGLSSDAFKPHKTRDTDGLSVSRIRTESRPEFMTPELVSQYGKSNSGYYFAIVSVKVLREAGMEIVAAPTPEDPGHALIINLRSDNRKSDEVAQWTQILAERLTIRVEGPFLKKSETE